MIKLIYERIKKMRNPVKYWRSKGSKIGSGCEINPTACFGSEPYLVTLGNNVRITGNVTLVTHDGGVWVARNMHPEYRDADRFGCIKIGNNVHVGMGATVMPGVTIGDNCIIGVGAIETKDIPNNSVAVGVPARVIETVDEYVQKNSQQFEHTKKMNPNDKRNYLESKHVIRGEK